MNVPIRVILLRKDENHLERKLIGRISILVPTGAPQETILELLFSLAAPAFRTILFCAYNAAFHQGPTGFLGRRKPLFGGIWVELSHSANEYESHQHRSSDRS
jgi:hypothetical protein